MVCLAALHRKGDESFREVSEIVFHHELENLPARAEAGRLKLVGWCAAGSHAPDVRLAIAGRSLEPRQRLVRADVAAVHGMSPDSCPGFSFEAEVPPGAHLAELQAAHDGGWHRVRRFLILSTPGGLGGAIEHPVSAGTVRESTRIQGWCAHPHQTITEVSLSYGNVRLPCDWGLPRSDVPQLVPSSPDAARAGFIANKNLPASRGALRVRARTSAGEAHFLHPPVDIDVVIDEDRASPLLLPPRRAVLGPVTQRWAEEPAEKTAHPLRLLFALYGDFTSNSAIHVMNLARQLARRGHTCTVAVPHHAETAIYLSAPGVQTAAFQSVLEGDTAFDLVHAWTTRENVRQFCATLAAAGRVGRLVVHLEDNELRILELSLGRRIGELEALPGPQLDQLVPPTLSHPLRSREFMAAAAGVTVIIDTLRQHVPTGPAVHTLWPAADREVFFPRERPTDFRRALGWDEDVVVLFYHGNVHAANRAEVRELYRAVDALNCAGQRCVLLRLGRSDAEFVRDVPPEIAEHVIELGQVPHHHHLGQLLSLADYFVQPGEPDEFNDYRLPSKLPEFFAIGRPVILPRTNLGRLTRHGTDAYVLDRADAAGISAAIRELQADAALRARLTEGARAFAREHFDWKKSARALEEFYRRLLPVA